MALLSLGTAAGMLFYEPADAHTRGDQSAKSLGVTDTFQRLALVANDIIYSPRDKMIYASRPSSVGVDAGNSISKIDPLAARVVSSTFVGSEPDKLAVADDGSVIYVALDGAASVRRFDPMSQTAGAEFTLGYDGFFGVYGVSDMVVSPGKPNRIAVARTYLGTSPPEAGVAIFDNGVQLPKTGPGHIAGSDFLAFGSPSTLYGGGYYDGIRTMTIDDTGVAAYRSADASLNVARIIYDNGLIYASGGQVIDPTIPQKLGTFAVSPTMAFIPDSSVGRVFFASRTGQNITITAYDMSTFIAVGSITIPNVFNDPTRLLRYGTNGLALKTSDSVYLIQTSLIPTGQPLPIPSLTPTPSPTPSPTPAISFVRPVDLPVNDVVYNPATKQLYASVPSSAGVARGNTITAIDPLTGELGQSTFIGSEPNKLAMSDNNRTLYTRLEGTGSVVRSFDMQAQTSGQQFNGPTTVYDMKVMPGSPQTLAFASGYGDGLSIYDNGVKRGTSGTAGAYGIYTIDFADPTTIYGFDSATTAYTLIKFLVTPSGPVGTDLRNAGIFGSSIRYVNGLLYASGGRVLDPQIPKLAGTFQFASTYGSPVEIDAANNRVYTVNGNVLSAFDMRTYVKVGSVTLSQLNGDPTKLVRWGENGLALRTSTGKLYLIQSKLVNETTAVPIGLNIRQSTYSVGEGNQPLVITVDRTGDLARPVSVDYTTVDGTATAGSDFIKTSGTLDFAAGETSKTISIPIINDNVYELAEDFTVKVTTTASENTFILSPSSASITVFDNDPMPSIQGRATSVTEPRSGSVVVQVPITLSNPAAVPVTVQYSTSNITATSGLDYVATSGALTFAPGETTANVPVVILADTINEPNETFSITLSNSVNGVVSAGALVTILNLDLRPAAASDFDGDRKSDVAVFRPSNGNWYLNRSRDGVYGQNFGVGTDKLVPADYDGDGKTDLAVYRPSTGVFFIYNSINGSDGSAYWGTAEDIPTPADFDGDGKADIAIFRPSTGSFWIRQSASGNAPLVVQYGANGDQPVVGDYDGDGKADVAVYRPSTGVWYRHKSTGGDTAMQWGVQSDKAVPGDYDGDGKTDVAVYRASTGVWFIANSGGGYTTYQFGFPTDVPAPADYDGDGKVDMAVFRPSEGNFWINGTASGVRVVGWGQSGDIPIESAYVR